MYCRLYKTDDTLVMMETLSKLGNAAFFCVKYGSIWHCLNKYGVSIKECVGTSMEDTLHEGDYTLVIPSHFWLHTIKKMDIIAVRSPIEPDKSLCKRVVGMPGDKIVNIDTGQVVTVPPYHVWIEGDNKPQSKDSRVFGCVPFGLIRYKIVAKLFNLRKKKDGQRGLTAESEAS